MRKHAAPNTKLVPHFTAGCCHLANLMASS